MKTFAEWTAERQEPKHNLNRDSSYYDIVAALQQAVTYMQAHPDHPSVDSNMYGWNVKVWRRFINDEKLRISYKPSYQKDYYSETPSANLKDLIEKVADMLYKYRGST